MRTPWPRWAWRPWPQNICCADAEGTSMAYRGRRTRTLAEGVRPKSLPLCGEAGLVAAFLRLLVDDLTSADASLREAAAEFLADDGAVRFWCSLGGVDDTLF